jgi:hypothetical protein
MAMPVIRVDDQVYTALNQRAVELGLVFPSPNDVLHHDYVEVGQKAVGRSSQIGNVDVLKHDYVKARQKTVGLSTQTGNILEIELKGLHTPRQWALIPVPKDKRRFFPGYKVYFDLTTDVGVFSTRLTSAQTKGTPLGDPHAGAYIQGNLRDWYNQHPELKPGDKLRFEVLEAGKRYKLSIIPSR